LKLIKFKKFPGPWHQISRAFQNLHWFPQWRKNFQNFKDLSRRHGNHARYCHIKSVALHYQLHYWNKGKFTMHTSASSVQFTRFQTPNQQMIRMQTTVIGKLLQYKFSFTHERPKNIWYNRH